MGGVSKRGLSVDCDRCQKSKLVPAEAEGVYEKLSTSKTRVRMLSGLLVGLDGSESVFGFDFLCPDCVSAVAKYLSRVDQSLSGAAENGKASSPGDDGAPAAKRRRGRPPKETPAAAEAAPPAAASSVDDSELFD